MKGTRRSPLTFLSLLLLLPLPPSPRAASQVPTAWSSGFVSCLELFSSLRFLRSTETFMEGTHALLKTRLPSVLLFPLLPRVAYRVLTLWFPSFPPHFSYVPPSVSRLSSKNCSFLCSASPPCQAPSSSTLPLPTANHSSPPRQEITAANTMQTDAPHSIVLDYGLGEDMVHTQWWKLANMTGRDASLSLLPLPPEASAASSSSS